MPEIIKTDPLAAGLLEKFIEVYTEWWTASSAAIQGEPGSHESARNIQRLIDKRGKIRLSPERHSSGPHGKDNRTWQANITRIAGSAPSDAINQAEA